MCVTGALTDDRRPRLAIERSDDDTNVEDYYIEMEPAIPVYAEYPAEIPTIDIFTRLQEQLDYQLKNSNQEIRNSLEKIGIQLSDGSDISEILTAVTEETGPGQTTVLNSFGKPVTLPSFQMIQGNKSGVEETTTSKVVEETTPKRREESRGTSTEKSIVESLSDKEGKKLETTTNPDADFITYHSSGDDLNDTNKEGEISCQEDLQKECPLSESVCKNATCPEHPNAQCVVLPCTCEAAFKNFEGNVVNCSSQCNNSAISECGDIDGISGGQDNITAVTEKPQVPLDMHRKSVVAIWSIIITTVALILVVIGIALYRWRRSTGVYRGFTSTSDPQDKSLDNKPEKTRENFTDYSATKPQDGSDV